MSYKFTTIPKKTLYQSILSTSTTFKMSDIEGFNGVDLTSADFGTVAYGVLLNSDKSVMELFSFDPSTIASTSISFVYRGLQFDGDLTTEVAANKLDWTSGSTILIGTDSPQVLQWLKEYIDGIAIAGSPDMDTTTKGIAEEATQAEHDAKTGAGGTLARLAVNPSTLRATKYNDYVVDSVGTDSYAITVAPAITAYAAGQEFTFKAGTANTGACSLNVCGLGAKSIYKDISLELNSGDILQNQIVKVVYDGTNMQMVSSKPVLVPVIKTYLTAASPATWTKPAGLKYITVEVQAGGAGSDGTDSDSEQDYTNGGGAGGYSRKLILAASLGATETVTIGAGGTAGVGGSTTTPAGAGGTSSFGSHCSATGGNAQVGGIGSDGDINCKGGGGSSGAEVGSSGEGSILFAGAGGSSVLGGGGNPGTSTGVAGGVYGGGAGGAIGTLDGNNGGAGGAGIVIVTEYF